MVSQGNIVAANLVVAIAATIAVALRFVARGMLHTFGADDFLILAALPLGWGMCICTLIAVHYGLGTHILTVPLPNLIPFTQVYFASELIWAAAMPLVKISILLLYIRVFGRLRYFRTIAYAFGGFTVAWSIMVIFVCTFQCTPVAFQWDHTIEGGHCIDSWLFFVIGSSMDVFVDFVILILPLPAVWNLQLSLFQKLSLGAIFCLGSLTCVFSLVRLVAVIQDKSNPDATFALGIVAIWSTAEPCLGIVAACLPTLRPLVKNIFGKGEFLGKTTAKSNASMSRSKGDGRFQPLYNSNDQVSMRAYISAEANGHAHSDSDQLPMKTFKVETTHSPV